MADENVKRKADTKAEGSPGTSTGEATTDLLTSSPSSGGVVQVVLSTLLFGGLFLVIVGGVLWTSAAFGTYAAVVTAGVGCIVAAILLAQVAVRAGAL